MDIPDVTPCTWYKSNDESNDDSVGIDIGRNDDNSSIGATSESEIDSKSEFESDNDSGSNNDDT